MGTYILVSKFSFLKFIKARVKHVHAHAQSRDGPTHFPQLLISKARNIRNENKERARAESKDELRKVSLKKFV
jgi:hypothetical protein